jgi:hypothetical protein
MILPERSRGFPRFIHSLVTATAVDVQIDNGGTLSDAGLESAALPMSYTPVAVGGIEPPHDGATTHCLPTWLDLAMVHFNGTNRLVSGEAR